VELLIDVLLYRDLTRSNILAISLLFEVMYFNANDIGGGWLIIMKYLTKVCVMKNYGSNSENTIEFNLSRIGYFAAFLNDESLKCMISALIKLSSSSKDENIAFSLSSSYGRTLYKTAVGKLQSSKFCMKSNDFQSIPFPLVALLIVSLENYERYECFAESVVKCFSYQASQNKSSDIRKFSLDALSVSIVSIFGLNRDEAKPINKKLLIEPICATIRDTQYIDTAELGVTKLKQIIEEGYNLTESWSVIINSLKAIADSSGDVEKWGTCCSTAFACLKLVVDGKS